MDSEREHALSQAPVTCGQVRKLCRPPATGHCASNAHNSRGKRPLRALDVLHDCHTSRSGHPPLLAACRKTRRWQWDSWRTHPGTNRTAPPHQDTPPWWRSCGLAFVLPILQTTRAQTLHNPSNPEMSAVEEPPPSYEEAVRPRTWENTHPDEWNVTHALAFRNVTHALAFLKYIQRGPNNFNFCYVPKNLGTVLHALWRSESLLMFLAECPPGSSVLLWWTHAGHCFIKGGKWAEEPWQRVPE